MSDEKYRLEIAQYKKYLDMKDIILLTGYSMSTILKSIKEGKLKSYQNIKGGKHLFSRKETEKWLGGGVE